MGRAPCCDKSIVKRGPWSPEEDAKLKDYMEKHGTGGNWIALPQKAGLKRCGKSCRLRWLNYLRPNIRHGNFSEEEDRMILTLYANIGSRWSIIASQLPGRTDNDIKNYWNTKLKKKATAMGLTASTSQKSSFSHHASISTTSSSLLYNCTNNSYYNSSPTTAASGTVFHPQESFHGPMFMVGGEASCSSSDGSTNNIQNSQVKELTYEYGNDQSTPNEFQMCISNDGNVETKSFMLGNADQKPTDMWGDKYPFDYGIEDIKQLVSSDNSCLTFLFDDNKEEESLMYF